MSGFRVRLRRTLIRMFLIVIKRFIFLFYDKKYFQGRWFDDQLTGWRWALAGLVHQKIFGFNRNVKWPVTPHSRVLHSYNVLFEPDNLDNFQSPGCYIQASMDAKIHIGKGTYIAPNVGLITSNHDVYDLDKKLPGKDIKLGQRCWIGMNSVILPGVVLGEGTIVAAGSVVTKSFEEGHVVIGGIPAKVIKYLDKINEVGGGKHDCDFGLRYGQSRIHPEYD